MNKVLHSGKSNVYIVILDTRRADGADTNGSYADAAVRDRMAPLPAGESRGGPPGGERGEPAAAGADLRADNEKLRAANEKLRYDAAGLEHTIDTQLDTAVALREQVEALKAEAEQLKADNEKLKAANEKLRYEADGLAQTIDARLDVAVAVTEQVDALKAEVEWVKGKMADLSKTTDESLTAARIETIQVEQTLAEVQASTRCNAKKIENMSGRLSHTTNRNDLRAVHDRLLDIELVVGQLRVLMRPQAERLDPDTDDDNDPNDTVRV